MSRKATGKAAEKYRFKVGANVVCRTGADEWSAGRIVALDYREDDWPRGRTVPYQVELHDGGLIFVPQDVEQLCRLLVPAWWSSFFKGQRPPSPQQLRTAGAGKNVNEKDHAGSSALMEATRLGWQPILQELISMSADVNISNKTKQYPLHNAALHGADMTRALLVAKADPNVQDTDPDHDPDFSSKSFEDRHLQHQTPLHYCCSIGDAATAAVLAEAGADLNVQDAQFKSPLHLAIEEGNSNVIDMLLQLKADVNLCSMQSGMKNTPLMDAAHAGKSDLAEKLISAKADINAQGKQGMGALHLAARRGSAEVVRLLMTARADASQKSQCGTPVELAKKKAGAAALLELLGVKEDVVIDSKATSVASLDAAQRAALFLE